MIFAQRMVLLASPSEAFPVSATLYLLAVFILNATVQHMSLECLLSFSDIHKESRKDTQSFLPILLQKLTIKPFRFTVIGIQAVPCFFSLAAFVSASNPTMVQKFEWLWYTEISLVISLLFSLAMSLWIQAVLKQSTQEFMHESITKLHQGGISSQDLRIVLENHKKKLSFRNEDLPDDVRIFLTTIEKLTRLSFLIQILSTVVISLLPIFTYIAICFHSIISTPNYRIPLVVIADIIAPLSFIVAMSFTHHVLLLSVVDGDPFSRFLQISLPTKLFQQDESYSQRMPSTVSSNIQSTNSNQQNCNAIFSSIRFGDTVSTDQSVNTPEEIAVRSESNVGDVAMSSMYETDGTSE